MTAMSNADFAKEVLKIGGLAQPFRPAAYYDRDGDCIEFIAKQEPFYAERVDDLVTVYYGQESKEVVGSLIKGVSKFLPQVLARCPGFRIMIKDGRVQLEHLFLAKVFMAPGGKMQTLVYEKLIEFAKESRAEADVEPALA
jgi:hypothetical protein